MSSQLNNQNRINAGFDRAAGTYDEYAVLQRKVAEEMLERLQVI